MVRRATISRLQALKVDFDDPSNSFEVHAKASRKRFVVDEYRNLATTTTSRVLIE